jgi:DNA-binding MurR/RpiR family transcriptional regulator
MGLFVMNKNSIETVAGFHEKLLDVSKDFPKRLRQCADYIVENGRKIAILTVADLAREAGVQPSTMMRFCKAMGFSGYSDMQQLFRADYDQQKPNYKTRLRRLRADGSASPSALLAEFIEAGKKSLEMLSESIDSCTLDRSINILKGAETIHIVGLRRSFPVAFYMAYIFENMEIPALLHNDVGRLDQRHLIREKHALIAISFTSYSNKTIELAEYCCNRNIPIVAITDTILSPLRMEGAELLTVSETDFGDFRALSATLSLAITLAVAVGHPRGHNNGKIR